VNLVDDEQSDHAYFSSHSESDTAISSTTSRP